MWNFRCLRICLSVKNVFSSRLAGIKHFCVFVKGNRPIRTLSRSSVLIGSFWGMLSFDELYVNIRENRMCNQGWTIKRLAQDEDKRKKHITVKVNKVINRNPHQKAGINPGAHKA